MTKRSKRILFYSAVLVFLLLSYIVLLYAQGYKYSFSEGRFFRTGAISLKVNDSAKIFLDDKLEGETSFFNNTFSIDQLLPENYIIQVQKDNYSIWTKTASVEEGLVIDFPSIMILPDRGEEKEKLIAEIEKIFQEPISSSTPTPKPTKDPQPNLITDTDSELFHLNLKDTKLYQNIASVQKEVGANVKGFRLSKNKNKLVWWTENEIWVMWLNDTNYQPFYKKGDKELITRLSISIQNAAWFRDEDHIILEFERFDTKNRPYLAYKVVEIDKRGGVNIMEL